MEQNFGKLRLGARSLRSNKERWKLRSYEDPLQDAIYNTWGEGVDDWGTEEYTEEQLIDVLYEVCQPISLGNQPPIPYGNVRLLSHHSALPVLYCDGSCLVLEGG